mmetsp:Transcript_89071/g.247871  ORF Transcript_89071/g.247871 Transcript_89071/m.247871 type:complete len:346 (-) Transcript_89071:397-1434(-)
MASSATGSTRASPSTPPASVLSSRSSMIAPSAARLSAEEAGGDKRPDEGALGEPVGVPVSVPPRGVDSCGTTRGPAASAPSLGAWGASAGSSLAGAGADDPAAPSPSNTPPALPSPSPSRSPSPPEAASPALPALPPPGPATPIAAPASNTAPPSAPPSPPPSAASGTSCAPLGPSFESEASSGCASMPPVEARSPEALRLLSSPLPRRMMDVASLRAGDAMLSGGKPATLPATLLLGPCPAGAEKSPKRSILRCIASCVSPALSGLKPRSAIMDSARRLLWLRPIGSSSYWRASSSCDTSRKMCGVEPQCGHATCSGVLVGGEESASRRPPLPRRNCTAQRWHT